MILTTHIERFVSKTFEENRLLEAHIQTSGLLFTLIMRSDILLDFFPLTFACPLVETTFINTVIEVFCQRLPLYSALYEVSLELPFIQYLVSL